MRRGGGGGHASNETNKPSQGKDFNWSRALEACTVWHAGRSLTKELRASTVAVASSLDVVKPINPDSSDYVTDSCCGTILLRTSCSVEQSAQYHDVASIAACPGPG